jgi:hypothetical protein
MRAFADSTILVAVVGNLIPFLHFHFGKVFRQPGYTVAKGAYSALSFGYAFLVAYFFYGFVQQDKVNFYELIAATTVYATVLFVVLSETLIRGGGRWLTERRGEKWAKELDYIYLTFGAAGLILSTNRLEVVDHKLSLPEYVGPFVLATALVVRALKTRVEINDWNKLPKPAV